MIIELLTIAACSVIVTKSSDVVVEKATVLSKYFGISAFAIGMVLVALSTSLPEWALAILSGITNNGAISAGNVFGANIANITWIFGLGAILFGFKVDPKSLQSARYAFILSIAVTIYILFHISTYGTALGFYGGAALLLLFIWYAHSLIFEKKPEKIWPDTRLEHLRTPEAKEVKVPQKVGLEAFAIFLAAVGVLLGASYIILQAAITLTSEFGVTQSFIGATIISLGTTLPELSVGLQSFRKKYYELGLGNGIGSVIVNTTLVLGTVAILNPITVQLGVFIIAMLFISIALLVFIFFSVLRDEFRFREGIVLFLLYFVYIAIISYVQMNPGASIIPF